MIKLKSEREIAIMREAGSIVGKVLEKISSYIRPGVETKELDKYAEALILKLGGRPAFRGYKGYPASICASVNEVIVHGIPSRRILCDGDIISVDVGVELDGYYADAAYTYPVGNVSQDSVRLIEITRESLEKGIQRAVVGNRISDISGAVQRHVEAGGLNVIRDFIGHGIGSELHEFPEIPNFIPDGNIVAKMRNDPQIEKGMALAIEPMVTAGECKTCILEDGWTAITVDKSRVAHFEHTVAVTSDKPEILTLWQKKSL